MSDIKRVIRKPEAQKMLGISHSTLHERINAGLLPPPFRLSARAVGWFEYEIQYMLTALAAEESNAGIISVVKKLVTERKAAWAALRG